MVQLNVPKIFAAASEALKNAVLSFVRRFLSLCLLNLFIYLKKEEKRKRNSTMFILCLKIWMDPHVWNSKQNERGCMKTEDTLTHTHTLIKHDDTLCGHLNARTCSHESKDCSNTPHYTLSSSTLNEYIIRRMRAQESCRSGEKCEWAEAESDKWAASVALATVSRPSRNWSHMPMVWSLVYRFKTLLTGRGGTKTL